MINDTTSTAPAWTVTDDESVFWDATTGRVTAFVRHDGFANYYVTVLVSPLKALRLRRQEGGAIRSLKAFPRLQVELGKQYTMAAAQQAAESFS